MQTVDAVDGEIRLTANWDDKRRYVFIPLEILTQDAGRKLTRDEAIMFVRERLDRYVTEAKAQSAGDDTHQTIALNRRA